MKKTNDNDQNNNNDYNDYYCNNIYHFNIAMVKCISFPAMSQFLLLIANIIYASTIYVNIIYAIFYASTVYAIVYAIIYANYLC